MEQELDGTELEESIITDDTSNDTTPDTDEKEVDLSNMTTEERAEYYSQFENQDDDETEEEVEKPKDSKETSKKETKELATKDSKEPVKKDENSQSLKVKINGVEQEVKVEELLKTYQKSQGADQKFYEASQMKKQAEEVINIMKTRPFEVLEKLGLDIDELAEQRLLQKLQYEQMTDEEKDLYESKQKLKHYEEQDRVRREQEQFLRNKQLQEIQWKNISNQIQNVIEKHELPRDSYTVKKFLSYFNQAMDQKLKLGIEDLVELVKEDLALEERQFLDRYKKKDISKLMAELGDETVKAIQKEQVKKLKNPYFTNVNPGQKTITNSKKQKESLDDWFSEMQQRSY